MSEWTMNVYEEESRYSKREKCMIFNAFLILGLTAAATVVAVLLLRVQIDDLDTRVDTAGVNGTFICPLPRPPSCCADESCPPTTSCNVTLYSAQKPCCWNSETCLEVNPPGTSCQENFADINYNCCAVLDRDWTDDFRNFLYIAFAVLIFLDLVHLAKAFRGKDKGCCLAFGIILTFIKLLPLGVFCLWFFLDGRQSSNDFRCYDVGTQELWNDARDLVTDLVLPLLVAEIPLEILSLAFDVMFCLSPNEVDSRADEPRSYSTVQYR